MSKMSLQRVIKVKLLRDSFKPGLGLGLYSERNKKFLKDFKKNDTIQFETRKGTF